MVYFFAHRHYVKVLAEQIQQLCLAMPIQAFHQSIVINNFQVRLGEAYSQEIIIFFATIVVGIVTSHCIAHQRCCCRAMMPVGNVQCWQRVESLGYRGYGVIIVYNPQFVPYAIFGSEVIFSFALSHRSNHIGKSVIVTKRQEHRFNVGLGVANVLHAVFLFVVARKFMLLYAPFHIVLDIGSHNDTILLVAAHCLGIEVITFLFFFNEPTFLLEHLEVVNGALIHLLAMFICSCRKFYLGPSDMVQRHRIPGSFAAGFVGVQHVIRPGSYFFYYGLWRAQTFEWFYCHHNCT